MKTIIEFVGNYVHGSQYIQQKKKVTLKNLTPSLSLAITPQFSLGYRCYKIKKKKKNVFFYANQIMLIIFALQIISKKHPVHLKGVFRKPSKQQGLFAKHPICSGRSNSITMSRKSIRRSKWPPCRTL